MAHRDFAGRRGGNNKNKPVSKGNKRILVATAVIVVVAFGMGLYFLKNKTPEPIKIPTTAEKTAPKSVLPNRPEEVWSYIKALETRTVPIGNTPNVIEKNMRLTEEQRKNLLEMKQAEEAKKLEEQRKQAAIKKDEGNSVQIINNGISAPNDTQVQPKISTAKTDPASEVIKKTETKPSDSKPPTENAKKFGLQCGAFKNRAQAESLQGRLAMTGLNAQITTSGEWNRVRLGGYESRDAATQAQEKAKSIVNCVVIGM